MEFVKLDEQGRVSLPTSILHKLGLTDRTTLTAEDGGVLLRP
jgi:DNA-binding transcriptional regulator/RsmH inhibitor MraZ